MKTMRILPALTIVAAQLAGAGVLQAQTSQEELAKKLSNPISSLISVPLQSNWDFGYGSEDAFRYTLNLQPVVPLSIGPDMNLIIRTIAPYIYQEAPEPFLDSSDGMGDIVQSFFLSPKEPVDGWILGGGPVFLWPTAWDDSLGSEKWGAGPTAVALQQRGGWTYGALANHLWSYAGEDGRDEVNATFLQPFLTYSTRSATTFGVNSESTYDWEHEQWTVPINAFVAQVVNVGKQPIQFQVGARYYADKPAGGPDWGLRATITFLFPTGEKPATPPDTAWDKPGYAK